MNYWLICLPREDIEHCIKIETFGLSRKNLIANVKTGDKVICCAGKGDWKVIAVGEATSDYYLDVQPVFLKDGIFPDRFRFHAQKLTTEIDVIQVLDRLSFITNIAHWAVYFRNGIAKCNEDDWKLVTTPDKANQNTAKVE